MKICLWSNKNTTRWKFILINTYIKRSQTIYFSRNKEMKKNPTEVSRKKEIKSDRN